MTGDAANMETSRLLRVDMEQSPAAQRNPAVALELRVALVDLAEESHFSLNSGKNGPYVLGLTIVEDRLTFDVRVSGELSLLAFSLGLRPFRSVVRDYFTVCDSYYAAIRAASPSQIEAIDGGRRSLHNEGASRLRERLSDRITMDDDTARRLFTLLCVLHMRG
jgi:uncharacterized protein (UPF0262 family)